MTASESSVQVKMVALALYQIRVLLSGYSGSQNEANIEVRQAAHLAYALHNEALALMEGGTFDTEAVVQRLARIDTMLDSQFSELFAKVLAPKNAES